MFGLCSPGTSRDAPSYAPGGGAAPGVPSPVALRGSAVPPLALGTAIASASAGGSGLSSYRLRDEDDLDAPELMGDSLDLAKSANSIHSDNQELRPTTVNRIAPAAARYIKFWECPIHRA